MGSCKGYQKGYEAANIKGKGDMFYQMMPQQMQMCAPCGPNFYSYPRMQYQSSRKSKGGKGKSAGGKGAKASDSATNLCLCC